MSRGKLFEQIESEIDGKTLELEAAIAKHLGLNEADAKADLENLINQFNDLLLDHDLVAGEQLSARQRKVAETPIGRLLQERALLLDHKMDIIQDLYQRHASRGLSSATIGSLIEAAIEYPEQLLFMETKQIKALPGIKGTSLREVSAYIKKFRPKR